MSHTFKKKVKRQKGFTLLALLLALLLIALASDGVMTYVSRQDTRDREAQLLRIGQIYAQAIGAYYESSPGSVKHWPHQLQDLVQDNRFVGVKRHIRQIYADPITRSDKWGLVIANDGGISGVYSLATSTPIHDTAIDLATDQFSLNLPAARQYSDWRFIYQVQTPPAKVGP